MHRVISLFGVSLIIFMLTACAGQTPVAHTPTPKIEVAVFSTELPSTVTPTPSTTATPAATVGSGAVSLVATATPTMSIVSGPAEFGLTRPSDENPLTGLKVTDPALLHRRPIMVRIGNDVEARPQVGLSAADIVYEEMVEWWVTRFTAIYLSQDLETIAPIRSARLINLQLVPQYQGALANSGGSDSVRWQLAHADIINLDEFFNSSLYFYRENESWQTRLAFNAVTARKYLADEGEDKDVGLRGFVFSQVLDVTSLPKEAVSEAKEIIIPYPPQTSEAKWQYDPTSGRYLRFTIGEPMTDVNGSQLSAANVVIYFADHQDTDIVEDVNGATSIKIIVNGLGTAWLLRDGQILKGNWQTDGAQTPNFIFNDGRPMPFKPGNTWVEVIPLGYSIKIDGQDHTRLGDAEAKTTPESAKTPTTITPTTTSTPIGARPTATQQTVSGN